jgi:hypothetical protein
MAVVIPSFANRFPKPGLNETPAGAIVASTVGSSLGQISQSIAAGRSERKQLEGLADSFQTTSPEVADILRSQAQSIPFFRVGGSDGGRVGSGSAGSGVVSSSVKDLISFALDKATDERRQRDKIQMESIGHQNAMKRLGASFSGQMDVATHGAGLQKDVLRLKDKLDETIDDPEAVKRVDRDYNLRERGVIVGETNAKVGGSVDVLGANLDAEKSRSLGVPFNQSIDPVTKEIIADDKLLPKLQSNPGERTEWLGISYKDGLGRTRRDITRTELADMYFSATESRKDEMLVGIERTLASKGISIDEQIGMVRPGPGAGDGDIAEYAAKRMNWLENFVAAGKDQDSTYLFNDAIKHLEELGEQ